MTTSHVYRTVSMIHQIQEGEDLQCLLQRVQKPRTLPQLILPMLPDDMSIEKLGHLVECSKAHIYNITTGKSHPQRDIILRIAVTLDMDLPIVQDMLKAAHRTPLTAAQPRDICLIYGLLHHYDRDAMDDCLLSSGFPPLWPVYF